MALPSPVLVCSRGFPAPAQPVSARHIGAACHQSFRPFLHIGQRVVQGLNRARVQARQQFLVKRLHLGEQLIVQRLPRRGER